jgi:L-cysteine:1D-myo-inositol 2-amino-2-deoxy-alpha-D-glucopyranoside ligase
LKLYNSRTRQVESFEPAGEVATIYVCGITPYDTTHLGHAFTYTANDILIRYLEYRGIEVRYVQNVTDIDDDILRKAAEVGRDWRALGDHWTAHFIEDMKRLNVRPPDAFPRATDVIESIIAQVESLLQAGVGYQVDGSAYFEIESWPAFGSLSRLPKAEMLPIANERGNHPDDPNKRNPLDFVLWQASKPGEPSWESPWGRGRPGWHIECSTMVTELLGDTIDLHSGGADLLFPHHECEIAQVEPITHQHPFVRTWLHIAMVRYQGEKMSKSLGNLVMVRDLLERHSPDAIRLYLGRHHYRQPWEHSPAELDAADRLAHELRAAVERAEGQGRPMDASEHRQAFERAMDDDLDTDAAIGAMRAMASDISQATGQDVGSAQGALRAMASVFGLVLDADGPPAAVAAGWNRHLSRFTAADSA